MQYCAINSVKIYRYCTIICNLEKNQEKKLAVNVYHRGQFIFNKIYRKKGQSGSIRALKTIRSLLIFVDRDVSTFTANEGSEATDSLQRKSSYKTWY